jgi:tetratricopeptide (TPR) repeat protein
MILSARGVTRVVLHRYAESLEDFTRAIEAGRNDADTYFWRAQALMVLGSYAEAEGDFNAAIERGQDDASVYRGRAAVLCRLKRVEEALADCERADSRAPDEPHTHGCWADLHLARGEYQEAVSRSQMALKAAGGTEWHFELGLALLMAGRLEEAAAEYELGAGQTEQADKELAMRELDFWHSNPPSQIRNILSGSKQGMA